MYSASVANGTYDVYIGGADTGVDIVISGADNSAAVNYYTVSFSVANAGTASGSTVSATASGSSIASGATVLAGKTVVITATGVGATAYTYAWTVNGIGGHTAAAVTVAALSGKVDAACTVTGATPIAVKVAFDAEGGTVLPASQNKLYGSVYGKGADGTASESLPTPARTGYSFAGWWTGDNGTGSQIIDATAVSVSTDHTLYAKWTVKTFTVTFKDWDGTVLKTQTVQYGKAAEEPSGPRRTGYTFAGWNKDYDEVTSSLSVTALYTINTCTVSFNTDGGSAVASQQVEYGGSAVQPKAPEKDGYTFGGWYSESGLGKAYDFAAKVTADLTLYAKWSADTAQTADTAQAAARLLMLETSFEFAKGDTWECITSNFVMLGSAGSGTQVTWTSSNSDLVRITRNEDGSATGAVTRPQGSDASVVITASVTKKGETVTKTFLLVIKRAGAAKEETREATERSAAVQAGEGTASEMIRRTTLEDGTGIDYVSVTNDTVQALINQGVSANRVIVRLDNDADNPADEFAFEVLADTVSSLGRGGLGVTLESPAGSVSLSAEVLKQAAQSGMSLYFRIVPVSDEAQEAKESFLNNGAIFSLKGTTGKVFGTPKAIQTNMESFATTVILPLEGLSGEQLADEEFLNTLCVYVEHDDGTTELVYGTLVYTDGEPTGMQFDISKFSRFQIVSVSQAAASTEWIWIVCFADAGLLILVVILLLVLQRRRRRQVQL